MLVLSSERVSAGFCEFTHRHFGQMILDYLFGRPSAAAAVGANTEAFANVSVILALFNCLLNLLVGDGFA